MNFGPGAFPDLAYNNGRIRAAWQRSEGQASIFVYVEIDPVSLATFGRKEWPLEDGSQAFPRLAVLDGAVFTIYRDGGTAKLIAQGQPPRSLGPTGGNDPVCMGRGFAAWQDDVTRARVYGLELATGQIVTLRDEIRPTGISRLSPPPLLIPGTLEGLPFPIFVDDDRALVPGMLRPSWALGIVVGEHPDGGVLCRLDDGREYRALAGAETFCPKVCAMDAGRWAIATHSGARGVEIVTVRESDFAQPVATAPVVDPLPRPLYAGYFKAFSRANGFFPEAPGNWTLLEQRGLMSEVPEGLDVLATTEVATEVFLPRLAGVYVDAREYAPDGTTSPESIEQLERNIARARATLAAFGVRRPVVAYWDGRTPPTSSCDWIALQCYQGGFEPDAAFRADIERAIMMASKPVVLVAQAYDRNGDPAWLEDPDRLARLQAYWPELARRFANVIGILWFAYGRKGGTKDYPAVEAWHRATVAAIPSRPKIEEEQPMPEGKPAIRVEDWSRQVALGGRLRVLFEISGPRRVPTLTVDLIGDGREGQTHNFDDAREIAGVYFTPTKRGEFKLQITVTDDAGAEDVTGADRRVEVV